MKKIIQVRKIFVRQLTAHDCGAACLSMILGYIGRANEIPALQNDLDPGNADGLSLLELEKCAQKYQLPASAVEMDIQFLRKMTSPCILYMDSENGRGHFQVCFGTTKKKFGHMYLMADPAKQVYYLSETDLGELWPTRAALYFEHLVPKDAKLTGSGFRAMFKLVTFPRALWLIVPLLNLWTLVLGFALSWVLQKGVNDAIADRKQGFLIAMSLLLLIISLFRAVFGFVRQRILITLNKQLKAQLISKFLTRSVGFENLSTVKKSSRAIDSDMADIQKMQQAITVVLATLVPDGSLILISLSGLFFLFPAAGFIMAIFVIAVVIGRIIALPEQSFDYASLNELKAATEKLLALEKFADHDSRAFADQPTTVTGQQYHDCFLSSAESLALKICKRDLCYEIIGAFVVILILSLGILNLTGQKITYSTFMIVVVAGYLTTVLTLKVAQSLHLVSEGADAYHQFRVRNF